jgi:hypothetical protein
MNMALPPSRGQVSHIRHTFGTDTAHLPGYGVCRGPADPLGAVGPTSGGGSA